MASVNGCKWLWLKNLKYGLVWIWNGQKRGWVTNGQDLERDQNPEAQSFEIQTNVRHFVQNHTKSGQKSPDFEWSGFLMVGTKAIAIAKARPFENRTI